MRYKNQLQIAGKQLAEGNGSFEEKWNGEALTALVDSTKYFCEYWSMKNFYDLVAGKKAPHTFGEGQPPIPNIKDRSASLQNLLMMLFRNQAFHIIQQNTVSFFKTMTNSQIQAQDNFARMSEFRRQYKAELEILAMSLLDISNGFDFEEEQLMSILGKASHTTDDDLYKDMLDTVRQNPINTRGHAVRGFNRYVKPLLQGKL